MNTIVSRMISTGLFFLLIFLSGFWLSRSGKPYPVILFTIHKLIALGAFIFLSMIVYKAHQSAPLQAVQMIVIAITTVCLISLIITGGLVSLDNVLPPIIFRMHQIIPYLTVLSVGLTLYFLLLWGGPFSPASN